MRKKIDYSKLVDKAIQNLKGIRKLTKEFSKFEMVESVKDEIDSIMEITDISIYEGKDKAAYAELIENFCELESSLGEIEIVTSELIKKVNEMPEEDREGFYATMGIKKVEKEDQGISDERLKLVSEMMGLVDEILEESRKYFILETESYIDYEDEMNKD